MLDSGAIICLLVIHFAGDFLFQSDWMACNKSKNWRALSAHVGIYTATLFVGCTLLLFLYGGTMGTMFPLLLVYALGNGLMHLFVDAISSQATSYIYERSRHWFFVLVGLDQLVHQACLIMSLGWMANRLAGLH